jgi:hypothetical protein
MDNRINANAANEAIEKAGDIGREAIDKGREAVDKGYEQARDYVSKGMDYAGEVSEGLTDFVQRQPWLALVGAFVVGYIAARTLRRISL